MAPLTVTAKSSAANLASNSLGRKFQDPSKTDAPVFVKNFYYINESGAALAADSIIDLGPILGPGIILPGSVINVSAMGVGRTLDIGLQEYTNQLTGATVASSIDALADGVDVSSAVTEALFNVTSDANPSGLEIFGPVHLLAKIIGDTLPEDGVIAGQLLISKPL